MPTWAITDDTSSIAIAQNGVVIKNIDKDIVVLRVVPAGVGLNTTAIDQLYIEHDGEYSTQIPYNDVTVSGVTPSSVENFRTRVLTILNNNGGGDGGGNMSTSTYDPAGLASQVTVASIELTVDQAQAYDLSVSGVLGQQYIIYSGVTPLPSGVDHITVTCAVNDTGILMFDVNASAYLTAFNLDYPCYYYIPTNNLNVILSFDCLLDEVSGGEPTITEIKNDMVGITFLGVYSSVGAYVIQPSAPLLSIFTNVWTHIDNATSNAGDVNEIRFANSIYSLGDDYAKIGTFVNLAGVMTPADDVLYKSRFSIYGQIKN